ncbi:MAG: hypothetical protein DMF72_02015 [Acidobacteria bacterium]|nr:MAG: hypothetical protein DMF72_02015 [Acidobacteriota bacterium]
MKMFLLLPLLAILFSSGSIEQTPTPDGNQVAVLGFKWSKTRQTIDTSTPERIAPARAMIQDNKNFERNVRVNDPAGVRDPNQDTIDGRSAALEKSVQSAEKPPSKTIDAFTYQAKIHNASPQVVEIVFWEYQFVDPGNPESVTRRQFVCGVNIKPDKEKELQAFSLSGPPNAVSAASLAKSASPFQERVIINRVEFADGKSWMRRDWNAAEIKAAYEKAMAIPWSANEMCRGL